MLRDRNGVCVFWDRIVQVAFKIINRLVNDGID